MKNLHKFLRNIIVLTLAASFIPAGQAVARIEHNIDMDNEIIMEVIPSSQEQGLFELTAEGAVVIEQNTGKVLFGKQQNQRLYPASTTKILTALLAVEYGDLDDIITVGEEVQMLAWDGSKAGLEEGEVITLQNLVYGLLINSGNDAANTIAVHIARKVSGESLDTQEALDYFGGLMNQRAREAGAKNSHFVNPHGYHDPLHYSTPYDMALIGRAAMENELFCEAISVTFVKTAFWTSKLPRFWVSKNKLINEKFSECYYENAVGSKTGYTAKAGHCLVSFASKNGQNLVTAVMKTESGEQWAETRGLFEYGFDNYKYVNILKQGTIVDRLMVDNCTSDDSGSLAVEISAEDWGDVLQKKDIGQIKQDIVWDPSLLSENSTDDMNLLEAPINKGQKVGELRLTLHGRELIRVPVTAVRSVKRKKAAVEILTPDQTAVKESPAKFNWSPLVTAVIAVIIIMWVTILLIQRKKQRRRYFSPRRYWW